MTGNLPASLTQVPIPASPEGGLWTAAFLLHSQAALSLVPSCQAWGCCGESPGAGVQGLGLGSGNLAGCYCRRRKTESHHSVRVSEGLEKDFNSISHVHTLPPFLSPQAHKHAQTPIFNTLKSMYTRTYAVIFITFDVDC